MGGISSNASTGLSGAALLQRLIGIKAAAQTVAQWLQHRACAAQGLQESMDNRN
ncbi:MAG: hypothetical protein RR311_11365 [Comamonas sp.]